MHPSGPSVDRCLSYDPGNRSSMGVHPDMYIECKAVIEKYRAAGN
jgi:hypothetical protein